MKEFTKKLEQISNLVNDFVTNICATLMLVLFGIILYGVFYRYFLNYPLSWVIPIARMLVVWIGLLAISIAFKEGEHIAINYVVNVFPVPIQKIIHSLGYILIITYLILLIWKGFPIAFQSTETVMISRKIRIPLIWSMIAIPIGALANFIHLLPLPLLIEERIEQTRIEQKNINLDL